MQSSGKERQETNNTKLYPLKKQMQALFSKKDQPWRGDAAFPRAICVATSSLWWKRPEIAFFSVSGLFFPKKAIY